MTDLARYQAELTTEAGAVDQALSQLRALEITDPGVFAWAADLLVAAKTEGKALDDKRKEITGPILKAKAAIDALFMPVIERYATAEAILKEKIAAWTTLVEQQRRDAMAASAEEYQAGGTPTQIIPEPAKAEGVHTRKVWDFEITDPDLVPRLLCSPDDSKIRAWIKTGHNTEIPGVRVFERDQVSVRRKRG